MRTGLPNTMRENDIFTEIIDSGKMRGMLTHSEINDAFLPGSLCDDELEVVELEDIPDILHDSGVEAVDGQETTNFEGDELVEITPDAIRLRKKILDENERNRASKRKEII